jgi:hypothetical protein
LVAAGAPSALALFAAAGVPSALASVGLERARLRAAARRGLSRCGRDLGRLARTPCSLSLGTPLLALGSGTAHMIA